MKLMGSPEKLYGFSMWLVTLVFASFLIGFGAKIIADVPQIDDTLTQEQFADRDALAVTRDTLARLEAQQGPLKARQEVLENTLQEASAAYSSATVTFQNWLATRSATSNSAQDPEVIKRTQALDQLKEKERAAELPLEALRREQTALNQKISGARQQESRLLQNAEGRYSEARRARDFKVFGIRLAFTLPLLLIAGWMVARKRKSQYWPLLRGFVIAAAFAFFFELVPYLPDYGGYVRYGVGIVLTLIAGHYAIRGMQLYLVRRRETEMQTELARRASLDNEAALKKMAAKLCPACERTMLTTDDAPANFCVHCGLCLYVRCTGCTSRMNAFFQHCAACGTSAKAGLTPSQGSA
ncbi:MAG TPA: serine endopeptidase [Burkholderiaceae bacterium]